MQCHTLCACENLRVLNVSRLEVDLQKTQSFAPQTFGIIYTVYIGSVEYRDKPGISGIVTAAQQLSHGGTVLLPSGIHVWE